MSRLAAIIAVTANRIRCFFAEAEGAQQKLLAALPFSEVLSHLPGSIELSRERRQACALMN